MKAMLSLMCLGVYTVVAVIVADRLSSDMLALIAGAAMCSLAATIGAGFLWFGTSLHKPMHRNERKLPPPNVTVYVVRPEAEDAQLQDAHYLELMQ